MGNYNAKLTAVLNNIKKTQGDGILIDLNNKPTDYPYLCSSGSIGLDIQLGGGLPKGRIVEIFGQESSGKTTCTLHAIVDIQRNGGVAAFIDVEQAFDAKYFKDLGGNLEQLIFIQPDNAEQALNSAELLAASGEVNLIVLDSTNALVPQIELDGEAGDLKVGLLARFMSQHLKKINPFTKNGTTIVYISQMREKIGIMFGDPNVIGVGNAMKFYASQRIGFTRIGKAEVTEGGNKRIIGNETRATVRKNKLAPPFGEAFFTIIYGQGISQESEIIGACLEFGILINKTGTGAGIAFNYETPIWSGVIDTTEAKVGEALKTPEFANVLKELRLMLDNKLGKITHEDVLKEMAPLHKEAIKNNEEFSKFMELGNKASSSSKHVEALYYFTKASEKNKSNKTAQTKIKEIEKRIETRVNKGEKIDWMITNHEGIKLNVETGEEVQL